MRKWSEEKLRWPRSSILQTIREHKESGVPIEELRAKPIQKGSEKYPELSQAYFANRHHHYFSRWDDALTEVGIDLKPIKTRELERRRKERKQKLLQAIQDADKNGVSLNPTDIQHNSQVEYRKLYSWAYRVYGKGDFWRKALNDASTDLKKIKMTINWMNKTNVKAKMLERYASGRPMDHTTVLDEDPALEAASRHHYNRSWNKALRDLGLDADELVRQREPYSECDILLNIVMHYFQGENLNGKVIVKKGSSGLKSVRRASYKKFNSWPQTVREVGIDYSQFLTLTERDRENILAEIQELNRQGIPLNFRYIRKYFKKTYEAAERHIGRWGEAVREAGFDYDAIKMTRPPNVEPKIKRKRRTKIQKTEELIFIAQALDQYEICLDEAYVSSSRELKGFYEKVTKQSSWNEFLVKCSLRTGDSEEVEMKNMPIKRIYPILGSFWDGENAWPVRDKVTYELGQTNRREYSKAEKYIGVITEELGIECILANRFEEVKRERMKR
jgi:hypothetical protein